MAIKKLTDYLVTSPPLSGGGFSMANSTPSVIPKSAPTTPVAPVTAPVAPVTSPVAPVAPALPAKQPVAANPLFGPSASSEAPVAPAAPAGAATSGATTIPKQYLNTDGSFKTPDQVASDIGGTLKAANGNGDVGALALAQFGKDGQTAEEAAIEARRIGNTRNDIAAGETDPYGVASKSGIAYTPAELGAIEKAYAGIYDPALDSAMAKVERKRSEDEARKKAEETKAKDERDFENDIKKLAVSHGYDLEKLAKSNEYDVMLQNMKTSAAGGGTGMTPYSDERSQRTVQSVDSLLPQVDLYPGIFGRTAAYPIPDFLRSSEYRNFESELDTLKASIAFNELTAMREASKTGGALGNVSNIELGLLESALGALKMSQSPENFKEQLTKVKESINRWRVAQGAAPAGVPVSGAVIEAPDGTQVIITD